MSDEKKKPVITPSKNGPLLVKDLENLYNAKGERLETKPTMALCHCGQSRKKPICDGYHVKAKWTDERIADDEWNFRVNYEGKEITIHDNRGICAHSGFCTDGLPGVWRMKIEPWIDPDGASKEEIIATIRKCPSGALSYSVDGVEHRDQEREPAITISKDGPYWIIGGIELPGVVRMKEVSEEHYALCRCGGSKNKPFCDGTHWYIKFRDDNN